MKDIMKSVNIQNKEILEILNEFLDLWWDKRDTDLKKFHLHAKDSNRKDYISDEYKNNIINKGIEHDGYPEKIRSYSLKLSTGNNDTVLVQCDPVISKNYIKINEKLQNVLSTRHNALCSVYPPDGFISWHNNANAPSYNLIFTWSENGNGYWKHVDPYTGEDVTIQDEPGWQCKAFYFGAYEDGPENLVYHMASTDCWRMTVSYIFDRTHKQFWEGVIEEIETE
jgi:hypothetical protein